MPLMVRFRTRNGRYCVPVHHTLEVRLADDILPLPMPAPGIAGILERDGAALPVVNAFGGGSSHVLLIEADESPVGVLVEEVTGVFEIAEREFGPPPPGQEDTLVEAVICDDEGLTFVVDAGELVRWAHTATISTSTEEEEAAR